ncbi:MAG TPA: dTDP-4-dehydrorhamnose reductase [Bacteroidota bacterium]|nr:dTDP-4-dehydrorhamnose reductase [Bacteroidota bacterium]
MNGNQKVLILGSNGQLGKQFKIELAERNIPFEAPEETSSNVADFGGIEKVVLSSSPTVVVNCSAYNAVEEAERKPDLAYLVNGKAVENLAQICSRNGIFLVHYSSDYVFDGGKGAPYTEEDKPNPLNFYGKSKLSGERGVQDNLDRYLLLRTSWVYGDGTQNFIHKLLGWATANKELRLSDDEVSVPTSTKDLAVFTILALERQLTGLYHLTNSGHASRYEWGKYVLQQLRRNVTVVPVPMSTFPSTVQRPLFTALSNRLIQSGLGVPIPDWKDSCAHFLASKVSGVKT